VIAGWTGLAVGVGSSLGWAGLDATRKSLVRRVDPLPLVVWLTLGQLPLFVAWAVLDGRWVQHVDYVWPAAGSVALNVAANLLYMHAVRLSPLSLTVPLLSFVPVFTAIVANPILGELPSPLQLVGIGAVVVGALLLNAGATEGRGPLRLLRALVREPGSLPMLGVALCWSLTIVVDKIAIAHTSVSVHAAVLNAGIGVTLLVWMIARRDLARLGQIRRARAMLVVAVSFGACALGLQLLAIQTVDVAVFEAIKRAIGIVAAVTVGRIAFAEPVTGYKVAAVAAMAVGTAAILAGPPL
jgi:drug/metabolite transporter (DMT)-like permease